MAKQTSSNPADSGHIIACLEAGDDFAFEMEVLNLVKTAELRSASRQANHGGTYVDPVTELHRQYDIRTTGQEIGVRQIELTFMTHAALILISK
jgi:hypothetical protein